MQKPSLHAGANSPSLQGSKVLRRSAGDRVVGRAVADPALLDRLAGDRLDPREGACRRRDPAVTRRPSVAGRAVGVEHRALDALARALIEPTGRQCAADHDLARSARTQRAATFDALALTRGRRRLLARHVAAHVRGPDAARRDARIIPPARLRLAAGIAEALRIGHVGRRWCGLGRSELGRRGRGFGRARRLARLGDGLARLARPTRDEHQDRDHESGAHGQSMKLPEITPHQPGETTSPGTYIGGQ